MADELVLQSVAEINSQALTSRQVLLTSLLSSCASGSCGSSELLDVKVQSDEFASLLSKSIFEYLGYLESKSIYSQSAPLSPDLINKVLSHKLSRKLQFERNEVVRAFKVKSLAQKYIQFKDKNLSVYVTSADAKKYYESNSAKFGGLGFEQFETKIKSFLKAEIKKERVEAWVTSMQLKYNVKQFLN